MPITLTFAKQYEYDTLLAGITVPLKILSGEATVAFDAKIDTGSSHCIFQRKHAERLGLEVESGEFHEFGTATSTFSAFGHDVSLSVLGISVSSKVYFASEDYFSRNVLGRNGWLDRINLGLVDYEGKLFLSLYGDELA